MLLHLHDLRTGILLLVAIAGALAQRGHLPARREPRDPWEYDRLDPEIRRLERVGIVRRLQEAPEGRA